MNNLTARFLVGVVLLVPAGAMASTINVTNSTLVTLANNDSLTFSLAAPFSGGHSSALPNEIEMVLGSMPLGGPVAPIPGTSGVYVIGALFTGTLESADGSLSIPLSDPDAARLGLPIGDLLLTPGSRSGGSYSGPVDLLSAEVNLTAPQAQALFGSGEAIIKLHNVAGSLTFGYPGSLISDDFSASLVSGGGIESEGARVIQVDCERPPANTPEPATVGLMLIGLAAIVERFVRR